MKQLFNSAAILSLITVLSGCEAIGDIFKAGVWSGVLLVVGIIVLVIFLISKVFKK